MSEVPLYLGRRLEWFRGGVVRTHGPARILHRISVLVFIQIRVEVLGIGKRFRYWEAL